MLTEETSTLPPKITYEDKELKIPLTWVKTNVGQLYDIIGGGTPSTTIDGFWTGNIPWISSADIHGIKDITPRKFITVDAVLNSTTNLVPQDTIIVVTRVGLGKVALTPYPLCFSQDSQALILKAEIVNPKYALYYLSNAVQIFKVENRGTTIAGVTKKQLSELTFFLPPLPEQTRIVEEIEKQFTRLDAGIASLKQAQARLKRYKAAVLKAACEGQLVPQDPSDEPASVLLKRILTERHTKWEADQRAKGKDPAKLHYEEPAAPDISDLPELPEGWIWVSLDQLSWDASYGTSEKCNYEAKGPAVVRIPNLKNGNLDFNDLKYAVSGSDLQETKSLKLGDLLIIRTNGSKDLIGRSAVVKQELDQVAFFASYLIRFRLIPIVEILYWLSAIWDSSIVRSWVERTAATSAGQYNISLSALNKLVLPLPPLAEQTRIVAEVESRLSVIQILEATLEANLKRAERLRQSILQLAFSGQLVPQDPSDEPASVLLERIRAERETSARANQGSKPVKNGNRQMQMEGI